MTAAVNVERRDSPRHWLVVLCLVGLDYFSTLAYLPSIAVESAGAFAPLAAAMIVAVTWLMALPVYLYVVGRSSEGQGAMSLLQRNVPGWRGKLLVLGLLGFAAADFVVTRSLSVADATEHLMHNPHGHELLDQLAPVGETIREWLGVEWYDRAAPYLTRPVLIAVGLSITTFGLWWLHRDGFTRTVVVLAVSVVSIYLALVGLVMVSGLVYLANHPSLVTAWYAEVFAQGGGDISGVVGGSPGRFWLTVAVWSLPQMCLGLSGFELTMAVVPIVKGKRGESGPGAPAPSRIRNTRKLMITAAAVMAVFLTSSVFVTTLLVPHAKMLAGGVAQHRALAYLAHGGEVTGGAAAGEISPLFGPHFGNVFDAATIAILCLAGASVMVGLSRLVPGFLHRLGMDLSWAGRVGAIRHVLNAVILLVTIVFRASLSDQQWAYATSVLVLLAGAALAAMIDVQARWRGSRLAPLMAAPPAAVLCFLAIATGLTVYINRAGVTIALLFVATIFVTSFISRWQRSTELRFEGFDFADDASYVRWGQLCAMDRQVLVPHRPGPFSLATRDEMIRRDYFLPPEVPLAFIEVELGDPSDFYQRPRVRIERQERLEVIRVSKAVSVAHVLAAIGLEMARIGRPPILLFGWSFETPLAANVNFLLLGEGNIPWMVKALVRQATSDPDRQPRVVIG